MRSELQEAVFQHLLTAHNYAELGVRIRDAALEEYGIWIAERSVGAQFDG